MSRPVDVVLHIGTEKTGTTSVQQLLRHNRRTLRDRGVLYPRAPGKVRHVGLGYFANDDETLARTRDWLRSDHTDAAAFRRRLRRRLLRETAESGASHVVLSDEALWRVPDAAAARLGRLLRQVGTTVRLVAYLRRQDDHLVSRYQQAVKVGETARLAEWARRDFSAYYDYADRLRTWRSALAPDRLVVRRFDRATFAGGSLEADFFAAAALPVQPADLEAVRVRNESLGVDAVEVLRILNLHRVENLGLQTWQFANRDHVRVLRGATIGDNRKVTLSEAELDRFLAQWEASNRAVAAEFFGDERGDLFPTARRTTGCTTEQRLDPAALDSYLDLLEIVEDERPPLRAIAEREAARDT